MNQWDFLLLGIRWIHLVSACLWIGGSVFYLVILSKALKPGTYDLPQNQTVFVKVINARFKRMVDLCLWFLVISGSIILIDRATGNSLSLIYLTAISVKLLLVVILIVIILLKRRARDSSVNSPENSSLIKRIEYKIVQWKTVAYIGLIILFITEVLRFAIEKVSIS